MRPRGLRVCLDYEALFSQSVDGLEDSLAGGQAGDRGHVGINTAALTIMSMPRTAAGVPDRSRRRRRCWDGVPGGELFVMGHPPMVVTGCVGGGVIRELREQEQLSLAVADLLGSSFDALVEPRPLAPIGCAVVPVCICHCLVRLLNLGAAGGGGFE